MKTIWYVESAVCVGEWYKGAVAGAEAAGQIAFGNGASGGTVETDDLGVIFYE